LEDLELRRWRDISLEVYVMQETGVSFLQIGTITIDRSSKPLITFSYVSYVLQEDDNEQDRNDATA
jgi:hypothetical protein